MHTTTCPLSTPFSQTSLVSGTHNFHLSLCPSRPPSEPYLLFLPSCVLILLTSFPGQPSEPHHLFLPSTAPFYSFFFHLSFQDSLLNLITAFYLPLPLSSFFIFPRFQDSLPNLTTSSSLPLPLSLPFFIFPFPGQPPEPHDLSSIAPFIFF